MTETGTTPHSGTPIPDPDPDPGAARTGTETASPVGTETGTATVPGPGPELPETETRTRTGRRTRVKIMVYPDGSGPGPAGTRTETRTRTGFLHQLADGGYLAALTVLVGVVASLGQKVFAEKEKFTNQITVHGFDLTPWLAVGAFDLAAAALLHGGIRAARKELSPWPWWIGAAIVFSLSVWTNTQHQGAWITASASIALGIMWFLRLFGEYQELLRSRERAAGPRPKIPLSLLIIDRRQAYRAWVISRSKPIAAALAYRHGLGETRLNQVDMVLHAARLYLDVYADRLFALLNPHLAAAVEKGTQRPSHGVRFWQRGRRRYARRLAEMTATDAVDEYLGVPVIDRQGIRPAQVTYASVGPAAVLAVAAPSAQAALPAAADAAPAASALPAASAPSALPAGPRPPAVRRRAIEAAPAGDDPYAGEVLPAPISGAPVSGAPSGLGAVNWLSLEEIPGLPGIDPGLECHCHPTRPEKWCGRTLVEHVQRRGRYIREVITRTEDWETRTKRLGKGEIKEITDLTSSGVLNELGWVIDQILAIMQAERESRDAVASESAVVVAETIEP